MNGSGTDGIQLNRYVNAEHQVALSGFNSTSNGVIRSVVGISSGAISIHAGGISSASGVSLTANLTSGGELSLLGYSPMGGASIKLHSIMSSSLVTLANNSKTGTLVVDGIVTSIQPTVKSGTTQSGKNPYTDVKIVPKTIGVSGGKISTTFTVTFTMANTYSNPDSVQLGYYALRLI